MFHGTDKGFELERKSTRVEALAKLIRLLGKEDEALNSQERMSIHPFTDVPAWAERYVTYAYEQRLAMGVSGTKFGSDDAVTAAQYYTFVLRALGYQDGKTIVTLKRTGNSIYAVIESNKTFTDIAAHWARDDIQLLGSKLIVQGVNEHDFAPDRTMTRAEYTALLVRSLGLNPVSNGNATFDDVAAGNWYFGEIEAAVKAGLTSGDGSGNFNPNEPLTREQATVLTASALKFAGLAIQTDQSNTFEDSDQISNWAADSVNPLHALNILSGMPNGTFEPQRTLTDPCGGSHNSETLLAKGRTNELI